MIRPQIISLFTWIKSYWLTITLMTFGIITVLSLWPLDSLPAVPGNDKIHHFIAYLALMFPVALRKPTHWKLIGLLFIGYSGIIEILQPYVNRYGEWMDVTANTTGVLCGVLLAELILCISPLNFKESGSSVR